MCAGICRPASPPATPPHPLPPGTSWLGLPSLLSPPPTPLSRVLHDRGAPRLLQGAQRWRFSGRITLGGCRDVAPARLAQLVGHVPQHDLLMRSLTVHECLAYNSVLRLGAGLRADGHGAARVAVRRRLGGL